MNCQKCGNQLDKGTKFCGACGSTSAGGGKVLCDGCMGAFDQEILKDVEGKRLCHLCANKAETRRQGIPEAGNARRLAYQEMHEHNYPPPVSVLAILSLVSVFVLPILGIPAMILGAVALMKIRGSKGTLGGEGIAIAGLGLGALSFLGTIFCIAAAIPGAAVSMDAATRGATDARTVSIIKEIESAQQVYYCDHGSYGTEQNLVAGNLVPTETFSDKKHRIDLFLGGDGFRITAVPRDGKGTFFLRDDKGNLRAEYGRPATEASGLWTGKTPGPVRRTPPASG